MINDDDATSAAEDYHIDDYDDIHVCYDDMLMMVFLPLHWAAPVE